MTVNNLVLKCRPLVVPGIFPNKKYEEKLLWLDFPLYSNFIFGQAKLNMSSTPTLYLLNQTYSSWSLRAWLAARFVNYPCKVHVLRLSLELPYGAPEAVEMLAQAGPTKKVPTLHVEVDGEKIIIFETLAIIEFLYEGKKDAGVSKRKVFALIS